MILSENIRLFREARYFRLADYKVSRGGKSVVDNVEVVILGEAKKTLEVNGGSEGNGASSEVNFEEDDFSIIVSCKNAIESSFLKGNHESDN